MKAFISYSHRDDAMLERLHTHLAMLRREGGVSEWYDRKIVAGGEIDTEVSKQLESCQVFVALVSPDFLASGYCYENEMLRAIERHQAGELVVVPVILEPCDWHSSPLKRFKAVPKDGKPITEWTNRNAAWLDVVTELRGLVGFLAAAPGSVRSSEDVQQNRSHPVNPPRYRLKKSFDQVDRDDFRRQCFQTIRRFFERSCEEMNAVEGLRARYEELGPNSFTCTVVNKLIRAGEGAAHITVRSGGSKFLGDISWSFSARASENTANGAFSVAHDDHQLFLKDDMFANGGRDREWLPEEAANRLWQEFIEKAGITYD